MRLLSELSASNPAIHVEPAQPQPRRLSKARGAQSPIIKNQHLHILSLYRESMHLKSETLKPNRIPRGFSVLNPASADPSSSSILHGGTGHSQPRTHRGKAAAVGIMLEPVVGTLV